MWVLDLISKKCVDTHPTVCILSSTHALKNGLIKPQLQTGLVKHLPLIAVPRNQTVDLDGLGLANTVAPRLRLVNQAIKTSETLSFTINFILFAVYFDCFHLDRSSNS